ncbi:helix-turn-helix domain-containing protein [Enterococcus mundtii]
MNQFQFQFVINKQLIRIIKILDQFQHVSTCSAIELSKIVGASHRTILGDIKEIKEFFDDSIILTSSNAGYIFRIVNKPLFLEKKRKLSEKEPLFQIIESIFFSEIYSLNEWSEKLHSTKTSLIRYIGRINPILNRYGIELSTKKIDFIGNEINIRQFFHDFFYESDITPHSAFPSIATQEIIMELKTSQFFNEHLNIPFFHFNYILFITLERYIKGKTVNNYLNEFIISKMSLSKKIENSDFYHLKELVKKFYNTELSDYEQIYIYFYMFTSRSIVSLDAEKKFIYQFNNWPETNSLATQFINLFDISDEQKKISLTLFHAFFVNLFLKHSVSPVLIQNLSTISHHASKTFQVLYAICHNYIKDNISDILCLNEKQIEDVSADLTLYTDAIKNKYWIKKKKFSLFSKEINT